MISRRTTRFPRNPQEPAHPGELAESAHEQALGAVPHGQPFWRSRALLLGVILLAVVALIGPELVQATPGALPAPATPADAADAERIPRTAWALPVVSLSQGEPITWIIVLASIVAVTIIIQSFLRIRRDVMLPEESTVQIEQFLNNRQFQQLVEFTETDDSFVSEALNPALKRAPSFSEMREALETGVAERTAEEFRRLEHINILANVGPLLGLLGTVIGIMQAFLEMRLAGGAAEVGALAGGISTALGTTMLGLMLAIPCVICYGILRNKADRLTTEGAMLAEEFLLMIKPERSGSSRPGGATKAASGAKASSTSATRPSSPSPAATAPPPPPMPAES